MTILDEVLLTARMLIAKKNSNLAHGLLIDIELTQNSRRVIPLNNSKYHA